MLKQRFIYVLIIVMSLIFAGCSSNTLSPKAALEKASLNTQGANSYAITASVILNELEIDAAASELQANPEASAMALAILKDAKINIDGIYMKDPMRADLNMEIVLPGFMDMKLEVPMKLTQEKLYVKIPSIPLLQLPETVTGKFIEIDLNELAAAQGASEAANAAEQQQLVQELSQALLGHFDEKDYFSEPKAADAGLPDGLKADQIVRFEINEQNYDATVETLIQTILPELLDIVIANEGYLQSLNLDKADLEEAKAELNSSKDEIIATLKNDINFNLQLTGAIKDKYLIHQHAQIAAQATDGTMKVGLELNVDYKDINKNVSFDGELPTDTVTLEQLAELFQVPYGL